MVAGMFDEVSRTLGVPRAMGTDRAWAAAPGIGPSAWPRTNSPC